MKIYLFVGAAILSGACGAKKAERLAVEVAQELIDSSQDAGVFAAEVIAAIKVADENATPDENAAAFADELNATFAGCGTIATANAAAVTIDWSVSGAPCVLEAGEQGVAVSGVNNLNVAVANNTVAFDLDGLLDLGRATVDAVTTITVDPQNASATIVRAADLTLGEATLNALTNGVATFDNSGSGSNKVSFDYTRVVTKDNQERTQTWAGLIAQQGIRLPLEGSVALQEGDFSVAAALANDAAANVTLSVTVTKKDQATAFNFTVDTATDLVSLLEE